MPDTLNRHETLWLYGKREDFALYNCDVALDNRQYLTSGGTPVRHQKNQIVLHFTAGNGPARGSVEWWNMIAPLDATLFYCKKFLEGHAYSSPTAGVCPAGHGPLVHMNNRAGAHYVVERAADRLNAAQPYTDVIEVLPSDYVTWHGMIVNNCSIGIEHANIGTTWAAARGDTFTGAGAAKRPTDRNHWLHLPRPTHPNSNLSSHDFQAYEEEQYHAIIRLLRYLCIKHRIPRRFLGDTTDEKMERYWPNRNASALSKLMRFRGILSHMNCHADKECGGPAMHRNRLFRGIIDEWWMPVEVDGNERPYHMGPIDPQADTPSYFRWNGGRLISELFHDADLDALQETRSYYDLDRTAYYYAKSEEPVLGGTFPIGTNKVWHAGVHFAGPPENTKVYAAASGTIVAARLGSNAAVEADPELGSQRFVLIRHCVYWRQTADPAGGQRVDYSVDPTYFFTLYMHLAPFANLTAAADANPPWFNYWLRHRAAAADPNQVFCPETPVSVGDWIGHCGTYRNQRMIHFEVMSHDEVTDAPWDNAAHRVVDNDTNAICNSAALDAFVSGANVNTLDILRAAPDLRLVKSFHKSEWSLTGPDALTPVLPDAAARNNLWNRIQHFMWVADAVAACPQLSTQLCDASGMTWHYHPVTFMDFVNKLVMQENSHFADAEYRDTNVTMSGEFLTRFVNFSSGTAVPVAADNIKPVRPFSISATEAEYHFTRLDLACQMPGTHDPEETPPKGTKFHLSLLDVVENIRVALAASVKVDLSYVCPAHNVEANRTRCVLGTEASLKAHAEGLAIDIHPANRTKETCRALWNAARDAAGVFRATCGEHGGEPSHAESQGHVQSIQISTTPAVESKLSSNTALTNAEISAFVIHLELREGSASVNWLCTLKAASKADAVRVVMFDLIGTFGSQADAAAESINGEHPVSAGTQMWDTVIKRGTRAKTAYLRGGAVIGVFDSVIDAQSEAAAGNAWPQES
jgi:hypothetical protein